jgi:hypothetical protein
LPKDSRARRRYPHPPAPLVVRRGDDRETIKTGSDASLPPQLIIRRVCMHSFRRAQSDCGEKGVALTYQRERGDTKKKYEGNGSPRKRPKLIRQCRSIAAPALVVAAQIPKE